ncbi:MAG: cytochrome c-type biogenesis protein CcmE [Rickettsiales bacterium]|jgi:cytochrome c-type biogenesis protein CcmE
MPKKLKKFNPRKKQRIKFIAILSLISLAALIFIITNFRDNIVFFYSPSEVLSVEISSKITDQKIIRVGGLVVEGSIKNSANNLQFVITDLKEEIKVTYSGIKPDLFREKQGMVAKGFWDGEGNIFVASELLAKHDENYMPPEVSKALEKGSE